MLAKQALIDKIAAANKAYRDGSPVMSDQDFDDLCEELEALMSEAEYSAFRDSLHESGGKVKHPFIMGSLDKLKAECPADVVKFVKSIGTRLNASAKVDGISCRASYKHGKLVSATTRGDGVFGMSVSSKAAFVKGMPAELRDKVSGALIDDCFEIRGELVILDADFSKLNESSSKAFANARNACAGIMNSKEWTPEDVKHISFVPYTILGQKFTKSEQFKILESIAGFSPAWHIDVDVPSIEDIVQTLSSWVSQSFSYAVDGLVLCSSEYRNEEKYRPDACRAFKLNQQIADTRLVDVSWEGPSKDGFFTCVGIVNPVELGGATISRVTLHNLDNIAAKGIMYGSIVRIKRSGDVIPYLEAVVSSPPDCRPLDIIEECPCCGSKLVRDGVNMRCMNKSCSDQVVHRIAGFIKKLGVKSASEATLKKMGLTSFESLVSFKPSPKYKSETKLYDELMAKMFTQSREKLLGAMNFVGLSEVLVGKIVSHYGIDAVESKTFREDVKKSTFPAGVGNATMDAFLDGLDDALKALHLIVDDIRWCGAASQKPSKVAPVKGSICVTGSLKFGSRDKFLEFAREHGYESRSGVSRGLTYLVNNDIESSSSKNRKAKELGIEILTEDEFMKMLKDDELGSDVFEL